MSIKSQRNHLDLPNMIIKRQRNPYYVMNQKRKDKIDTNGIDNLSNYVDRNLKKTVKPRGSEYR